MSDPAFAKSLDELAAILKRLNEESDKLSARISQFEATLLALNPGVSASVGKPFRLNEVDGAGAQLAFLKWEEKWGLWVVRAKYQKVGDGWRLSPGGGQSVIRLVDATREDRAAAVEQFPHLVEVLKAAATKRLALIEAANKRAE
jgi:hypothetical protein